jgi:hypothetical protein
MRRTGLVTLKIVRWRADAVGFSGWDRHARAELKRRLYSAVNAPPAELRDLWRRIVHKEPEIVINVSEDAVDGLRHIIESMGADVICEGAA